MRLHSPLKLIIFLISISFLMLTANPRSFGLDPQDAHPNPYIQMVYSFMEWADDVFRERVRACEFVADTCYYGSGNDTSCYDHMKNCIEDYKIPCQQVYEKCKDDPAGYIADNCFKLVNTRIVESMDKTNILYCIGPLVP